MSLYHSAKYKLRNIYRTIDSLLDGDFPLDGGKQALGILHKVFEEQETKLDRAHSLDDNELLAQQAQIINVKIYKVLPIIGFVLRSTNVRNAFEMVYPLRSIARAALQGRPQLMLSSEWDYVPFAYPQSFDNLKSFILIGLPASEAASALLMPLAGHELGHAVWRNRGIGANVQSRLQTFCEAEYQAKLPEFKKIFQDYKDGDLVARAVLDQAIGESASYAARQAEELFSDLFAYCCFGASYLRSFGYILAPGEGTADAKYPLHSTRVNLIRQFAANDGVSLPDFASLGFKPDDRKGNTRYRFIVGVAERATASITDELWTFLDTILAEAKLERPKEDRAARHKQQMGLGIPSPQVECIGDVINAGWGRYDEIVRSSDVNQVAEQLYHLNEMLLKTIEVYEFKRRLE